MKPLLRKIREPRVLVSVALLALLLVPNNKAYLAVFFLYGLVAFVVNREPLTNALFATLLLSVFFERGIRGWFINVVPPGVYPWLPGYAFYFGLAPKLIILVLLLLVLGVSREQRFYREKNRLVDWLLLVFLGLASLSTLASPNLNLAALGLVRLFTAVGLFIVARRLFSQKTLRRLLVNVTIAALLLFGLVGSLQLVARQPLGLFLEDTGATQPLGYLTTDGEPFYRVTGFTGHPTFFGSLLSLLLPVSLGALFVKNPNWLMGKNIVALALILGLVALFATFSRSSWLATLVSFGLFFWLWRPPTEPGGRFWPVALVVLSVAIVSLVYLPLLVSRVQTFTDVFTSGTGRGRIGLVSQAWQMLKQRPAWGVGFNQFTQAMATNGLSAEARGFLFPVHNTFLLFFSELGFPAGLVFVGLVLRVLWQAWNRIKNNLLSASIWLGALTFVINAQFHTLFSQDPSFDLFMLYLAYLSRL